jgi:hypothetical protein
MKNQKSISLVSINRIQHLASLIEKIHFLEIILYAVSAVIMIFSSEYRIYGAFYISLVWITELAFGGACPLFILERKLRIRFGEKINEKRFLPMIAKKYFNINLSSRFIDCINNFFFIISVLVIIIYFKR